MESDVRWVEVYAWVCEVQLGRHAGVMAGLSCSKFLRAQASIPHICTNCCQETTLASQQTWGHATDIGINSIR